MMKKYIIHSLLLLSLLTSCSKQEDEVAVTGNKSICFTPEFSTDTRATASYFEVKDKISVFAFKNGGNFSSDFANCYANNVLYEYDGTQFLGINGGIFPPQDGTALTFQAIYPYQGMVVDTILSFRVKEDQSVGSNYTLSDLMMGRTASTTEVKPMLKFNHKLVSVIVNLSFEKAPAGTTSVTVNGVCIGANLNLKTGEVIHNTNIDMLVKAAENGSGSYKLILPPQKIASGSTLVTIRTEAGKTYMWKTKTDAVLQSGSQVVVNLKVSATGEVTLVNSAQKNKRLSRITSEFDVRTFDYENDKLVAYTDSNYTGDVDQWFVTYSMNEAKLESKERNETMLLSLNDQGYAVSGTRTKNGVTSRLDMTYTPDGYVSKIQENAAFWNMTYIDGNITTSQYYEPDSSLNIYTAGLHPNLAGIIFPIDNWFDDYALEIAFYARLLGKPTTHLVEQVTFGKTGTENTNLIEYGFDAEGYPIRFHFKQVGSSEEILPYTLTYTE